MYALQNHSALPESWDTNTGWAWYHTLAVAVLDDTKVLACPTIGEPPMTIAEGVAAQREQRELVD